MLKREDQDQWAWRNIDNLEGAIAEEDNNCVAFEMRQADGVDEGLAETNARAVIADIVKGQEHGEDYGLQNVDWAASIKAGEIPIFTGVGYMIYAVELAMIVGRNMRGVEDKKGPMAWTKANVAWVLRQRRQGASALPGMARLGATYADSFMAAAMKTVRAARLEGKS